VAQRGKPAGVGPTDHASSEDADLHGVPVPLLLTIGMVPCLLVGCGGGKRPP
jgi:hypothetical protein